MQAAVLQPGQVVRVRSRQYLAEEVVPPPHAADQLLVSLSCLDYAPSTNPRLLHSLRRKLIGILFEGGPRTA